MAEAKSKKSEAAKKIVDVKNSGDGASGTSRPVIVTNRPIMKDPMMAEVSQLTGGLLEDSQTPTPTGDPGPAEAASGAPEIKITKKVAIQVNAPKDAAAPAEPSETPVVAPSKKKLIIKPLSEKPSEKPAASKPAAKAKEPTVAELALPDAEEVPDVDVKAEPVATTEDALADETTKDDVAAAEAPAAKAEDPAPDTPADEAETADVPSSDDPASGLQPGRSYDETETASGEADGGGADTGAPEQIELDSKGKPKTKEKKSGELSSEQQKAIENGEYFLPITTAETKRLRREIVFATLFVTILIVVWLDIMLDAGLLTINGIHPVTNFF